MLLVFKKEITGFVANLPAFALLREAIHLVSERVSSGILGVQLRYVGTMLGL